jgi:hypothetical protein
MTTSNSINVNPQQPGQASEARFAAPLWVRIPVREVKPNLALTIFAFILLAGETCERK